MRLLNCLTWRLIKDFEHKTTLSEYDDFVPLIISIIIKIFLLKDGYQGRGNQRELLKLKDD